jgi:hypothetical protein
MADRLNVGPGDDIFAVETSDGILLTPYDEATLLAVESGRRVAKRYRAALRELAH